LLRTITDLLNPGSPPKVEVEVVRSCKFKC
jgi:hypothetical protein